MFPVRDPGRGRFINPTLWVKCWWGRASQREDFTLPSFLCPQGFTASSLIGPRVGITSGLSGLTQRKMLKELINVDCPVEVLESFYLV